MNPELPRTSLRAEETRSTGSPPSAASTLHYVLFGREGLRAGWGIILFLAIIAAVQRCLVPLQQMFLPAPPIHGSSVSLRQVVSMEGTGVLALVAALWLMGRLESRPVESYGPRRTRCARYLFGGLMWGAALLSLLVYLLRSFGLIVFNTRLLFGPSILRYASLWLVGFLLVALQEELHFRSYLQFTLTRGLRSIYSWFFGPRYANTLGFWTAALALSGCFGIGHRGNADESPIGLFAAAIFGLLFCLSLWRTGSLWWAIGFHAAWDWAQSFLYGVPDSGLMAHGHLFATHPVGRAWLSGGLTGPEGSILLLPVAVAAAGVILLTLPRTHHGYVPIGAATPAQEDAPVLP